jgi:hypothetical protein
VSKWLVGEEIRHQVAIAGRVTDAETLKPIRGARVSLDSGPETFTAADGHFHFLDLPSGQYTLKASLPGAGTRYGQAQVTVPVFHDAEGNISLATANLELPPTTLKGRITNQNGDPVAMAQVRVQGSGERTLTEVGGHYALTGLEASKKERTVGASAQGYWESTRFVPLQAGKVETLDLVLTATTDPKPEPSSLPATETISKPVALSEPAPPAKPAPEFEALTQPEPSTEFTPEQIAGCQLWLTAAAITGVNESDPVAMWPDKSGHNHHANQSKVDRRPTYQAESIGGQPGAYFDGFEDSMTLSFSEPSTNHTFFFVCNSTLLGEGDRSFLFDVKRGRLTLDAADMNPPYKLGWHDSAWHEIAEAQTGPQILTWFFADRTGEVFRNGVLLGQADYTPRSLRGKMSLGANYNGSYGRFNGIIAEVIYYNRALTLVERQRVEQYLSERFGIPLDG